MAKKKNNKTETNNVSTPTDESSRVDVPVTTEVGEPVKYVVTRAGHRVSEKEYLSSKDPDALLEKDFWKRVAKSAKDGSKVEIVQFDKRLHRLW